MACGAGAVGLLVAIIVIALVGAIAGWLAGKIMAGRGFGFWANAGLGVVGATVGSFVFAVLGLRFRPPSHDDQGYGRGGDRVGNCEWRRRRAA
jgi:uncharacterized membrane protein YeaQ/YmgE (transglycosylase-associated protein family)